ncbi:MAG: hypothetical protein HKO59_02025 [Phycisphaerales bacterium]|nr:hypothetical protein [Phycisphaerales bacterium]NNM24759.1 hypothetical protein [Phycisphaerales bacterium]
MNALKIAAVVILAAAVAACGRVTSSADAAPDRAVVGKRTPVAQAGSTATPAAAATPAETVEQMLELARAGEWGAYIDRFYGEQHKFRPDHDDRGTLIARFSERSDALITALEAVTQIEPVISADGDIATFQLDDDARFMLYRVEDGRWMFHL